MLCHICYVYSAFILCFDYYDIVTFRMLLVLLFTLFYSATITLKFIVYSVKTG